jgi:hypothetical protein
VLVLTVLCNLLRVILKVEMFSLTQHGIPVLG